MTDRTAADSRRRFLKLGSIAVASAAVAASTASAAGKPAVLDEKDPQAQALGYRSDTTKVDKAKYPKHAASQMCGTCTLFQGKAGDATGACALFAGKAVNAKGWCSTWTKKA